MMKLAIFGAGGHGKVVASIALRAGWKIIEFYDDAWPARTMHSHWPMVGNSESLLANIGNYDGWIVAIGNNRTRLRKIEELEAYNATLVTLIDPDAMVSSFATVGAGTVIVAKSAIQVDCELGRGCIVNTGATVGHDCKLKDAVHVSSGANLAGGVQVGKCSWIGIGSAVKQLVCIGDDVMVGVGSAVVKDVASGQTVVGAPARPVVRT